MNAYSVEDCLAVVERSPAAVALHDKSAWQGVFAAHNIVEDPVGSAAHVSGLVGDDGHKRQADRLGPFYETFIAPNQIQFHVKQDIVCGLHVMRDITIEIVMSEAVTVHVPVHLLYELVEESGELKIFRLAAHWELGPMLWQQMSAGSAFLGVGAASAWRMLKQLGLRGMFGFGRAVYGVGAAGKEKVADFVSAVNAGNLAAVEQLMFASDTQIAFPYGQASITAEQLCNDLCGQGEALALSKVLAAGNFVSATFACVLSASPRAGVVLFELNKRTLKIENVTFYWQT